jgi:hypothetical protein
MGLVLGQHHRTGGQVPELLMQVGEDPVTVGVVLGDQAGRRQAATWRTRRRRVRWLSWGRPSWDHSRPIVQAVGRASSRRMRRGRRELPGRGRPARGRSPSPLAPWAL